MIEKYIFLRINSIYRILILSLLNDVPSSGYQLIQNLQGILGNKPSHGKVYPFLNELLKFNIIKPKEGSCDLRRKVVYELTSEGKILLKNTLGHLESIFENFLISCLRCGVKFYSQNSEISKEENNYCCLHCETV